MKTERALQRYLKDQCTKLGVLFHKLESRTARGFPDVFMVYDGRVILVELKSPRGTGKLSKLQARCINNLRLQGLIVVVAASKAEVDKAIDLVMGRVC